MTGRDNVPEDELKPIAYLDRSGSLSVRDKHALKALLDALPAAPYGVGIPVLPLYAKPLARPASYGVPVAGWKMLPVDLETHLGDFWNACMIAQRAAAAKADSDDTAYWVHQLETIKRIRSALTHPAPVAGEPSDLVERLNSPNCPFCGHDPYHYVDNGVGMEAVAVTCCENGIALFQHSDEGLVRVRGLLFEAAATLSKLQQELDARNDAEDDASQKLHEVTKQLRAKLERAEADRDRLRARCEELRVNLVEAINLASQYYPASYFTEARALSQDGETRT